jgi:hypothetical protein
MSSRASLRDGAPYGHQADAFRNLNRLFSVVFHLYNAAGVSLKVREESINHGAVANRG